MAWSAGLAAAAAAAWYGLRQQRTINKGHRILRETTSGSGGVAVTWTQDRTLASRAKHTPPSTVGRLLAPVGQSLHRAYVVPRALARPARPPPVEERRRSSGPGPGQCPRKARCRRNTRHFRQGANRGSFTPARTSRLPLTHVPFVARVLAAQASILVLANASRGEPRHVGAGHWLPTPAARAGSSWRAAGPQSSIRTHAETRPARCSPTRARGRTDRTAPRTTPVVARPWAG